MHHGGKWRDPCAILTALGVHHGAYKIACECRNGPMEIGYEDLGATEGGGPPMSDGCLVLPPDRARCDPPSVRLSSWRAYYAERGLPLDSPAALLLHFPLTVYHILCTLGLAGRHDPVGGSNGPVRVHYLGAEGVEWILGPTFRELAILLPQSVIEIDFIGASLDRPASGKVFSIPSRHGGRLTLRFHREVYDDALQERLGGKPDVAIALNAGFAAPEYRWAEAIRACSRQRTPLVFTDCTEHRMERARQLLAAHGHADLSWQPSLNPFRQPMRHPRPSDGATALPCMLNGFVAGVNTPKVAASWETA